MKKVLKNTNLWLFLLVCLTCLPLMKPALYQAAPSHDLLFHIQRIAAIEKNIEEGVPLALQMFWCNDQGYAVGAFYPSIFLVPFALLYKWGLHLDVCWKLLTLTINVVTVYLGFYSFERIFEDKRLSFVAIVLYALAPYRLTDVYLRAALGESLSMMFLPMVAASLYGVLNRKDAKDWIRMALAYAGVCCSHELSLFFVVVFTGLYCLLEWRKTFTKDVFVDLVKATCLAVGLCLFFLIPMHEFSSSNALKMNFEWRDVYPESLYEWQLFGFFEPVFGGSAHLGFYGHEMPFYIGWPLLCGLFVLPFVHGLKKKDGYFSLYVLSIVALWLTSRYFPYDRLQEYSFANFLIIKVQYPWRFEMMVVVFLAILTPLVFKYMHKDRVKKAGLSLVVFACVLGCMHQVSFMKHANYGAIQTSDDLDSSNFMGGEFLPANFDYDGFKYGMVAPIRGKTVIESYRKDGLEVFVKVKNEEDQFEKIALPLTYYKQYKAVDEAGNVLRIVNHNQTGKLAVVLPSGFDGVVHVYYAEPFAFVVSRVVSFVCLCFVLWKLVWL